MTTEIWGTDAVPFRAPTSADYAQQPTVRHSLGEKGSAVRVTVPSSWVYRDESIPSDHNDWLYYDPRNPAARFEFSATGCIGCLYPEADVTQPLDLLRNVPSETTHAVLIDDGTAAAFTEAPADGYGVDGVVRLIGSRADLAGSATYRVALPSADHALATVILDSVVVDTPS